MINPFKQKEIQRIIEEQEQEKKQNLAYSYANTQEAAIDEQNIHQRKDILVQLSQWQQDRSEAMRNLFLKLSGYAFNTTTGHLIEVKWDRGYVSLYGAQKLVNWIETLDRNVMLANWSEHALLMTLREGVAHPLRRFIFENHQELGLKINHAEAVFWIIMNAVEPTYWRGWNDGERRKDREIIKVQELRTDQQQKKRTVFGIEA